MAEDGSSAPQSSPHGRRSSFAGQTFADLFGAGRSSMPRPSADGGNNSPPNQYAGAISQAAAKAQQRRMSLTTLGLSGTANGTSPYNSYRGQDSVGSANSSAIDEVAVDDDVGPATARDPTNGSGPNTPFARRMSFGARALRDVSGGKGGGGGGGGGGSPGQNGTASPSPAAANKTPSVSTRQNGTISSRTADAKGRGLFFASASLCYAITLISNMHITYTNRDFCVCRRRIQLVRQLPHSRRTNGLDRRQPGRLAACGHCARFWQPRPCRECRHDGATDARDAQGAEAAGSFPGEDLEG